ncbi:hypothetical protein NEHOM01_2204, partial [Nematocida homosporus]|uniref:uncharacterized protein n=1 Tax=Nematocida homosporus TaxID=1912981 RepID=UPI002220570A
YLHHYLCSLIFAIIGLAFIIDQSTFLCLLFLSISFLSFIYFSPITYGHLGPIETIPGKSIFTKWNLYTE